MEHKPGSLLRDFDITGQLIRRNAVLTIRQHPHGREPLGQRDWAVFHDRADLHAELLAGMFRLAFPAPLLGKVMDLVAPTGRAGHAVRPAHLDEVSNTPILVTEIRHGFLEAFGRLDCLLTLCHTQSVANPPWLVKYIITLARDGPFASEDRILDVAIALERMYELDQGEVSFKLKTRAACFLESDTEARLRVFKDVGAFYEARSKIVHNSRQKRGAAEGRGAAFKKGFDVARRSVVKLLRDGPPNWNEMVIAGGN